MRTRAAGPISDQRQILTLTIIKIICMITLRILILFEGGRY